MKRRSLLKSAALASLAATTPAFSVAMTSARKIAGKDYDYVLTAEPARKHIVSGGESDILGFNGDFPAPCLRAKQGKMLRIKFINKLDEPTTIHWHGIRIDFAMDGVPFLSQDPIGPGESFDYEFVCPDAGTFWYHPHINSIKQLGMGLVGALIVEEAQPQNYHDVIIGLKDWRLKQDGSYLPLSIPRMAARDGTLGTVATVNGEQSPIIDVPRNSRLRLRLLNLDNTRVYNLSLKKHASQVIAIDGSPVAKPYALDRHATGAGMRLDLAVNSPDQAGVEIPIYDMKGRFGVEICRLRTSDTIAPEAPAAAIAALPNNPVPVPVLKTAETMNFVFEWEGALSPSNSQGNIDHSFWLINRRAWSSHSHRDLPAPLAELTLGKSYIFELHNATPHQHPIHLHGLIFTVLDSDKKAITPFHSDTVLLEKNERVRIAFVADNPGKWMFHCHVIEHMKTGLMGYITIA